eukprot:766896-Hanusia_phi.AAC.1
MSAEIEFEKKRCFCLHPPTSHLSPSPPPHLLLLFIFLFMFLFPRSLRPSRFLASSTPTSHLFLLLDYLTLILFDSSRPSFLPDRRRDAESQSNSLKKAIEETKSQ